MTSAETLLPALEADSLILVVAAEAGLASVDAYARKAAIERVGKLLRTLLERRAVDRLARSLAAAAGDSEWRVREAVVEALEHLHHPSFFEIVTRLQEDERKHIREAAARAAKKRDALVDTRSAEQASAVDGAKRLAALSRFAPELVEETREHVRRDYHDVACALSHGVRNMLGAVDAALAELEAASTDDVEARRAAAALGRERCKLTLEILERAMGYTSGRPAAFTRKTLAELLRGALDLATKQADADVRKTVRTTVEVDEHLVLDVSATLVDAFTNLLRNALDALEGRSTRQLTIRGRSRDDGRLVVQIVDTGKGIAPESLRTLFRPGKTSKAGKHIGWGLPCARKAIVVDCGGEIDVQSDVGQGTVVTVVLPVEQEAA